MRLSLALPLVTLLLACTTEQDLGSNNRGGSSTSEVGNGDPAGSGGISAFCAARMAAGDGCYCDCADVDPDCGAGSCVAGSGGVSQAGSGGSPGAGGKGLGMPYSCPPGQPDDDDGGCYCACRDLDSDCLAMENGCYGGEGNHPSITPVPPGWTCYDSWYGDETYCDPHCGIPDPDC